MHVINSQLRRVSIMMIIKGYLIVSRSICFTERFQAKLTKDGRSASLPNGEMVNLVSAVKPQKIFTMLK